MREPILRSLVPCAAWLVLGAPAHATELRIPLLGQDEFVSRSVTITRADGATMRDVQRITGYDATTRTFIVESATRGPIELSAADVKAFAFAQTPARSSPLAQTCAWTVEAVPGRASSIDIPASALRIEQDALTIDAAGPRPGGVVEATRLSYDAARASFTVALRAMQYRRQTAACGSNGGPSKALQ